MLSHDMNKNREITRRTIKDYFIFNRNILIGFAGAFLTSAGTSQVIARFTSSLVNSLISLVAELSVFLAISAFCSILTTKTSLLTNKGREENLGE
jgi:hypothetical protein